MIHYSFLYLRTKISNQNKDHQKIKFDLGQNIRNPLYNLQRYKDSQNVALKSFGHIKKRKPARSHSD